jgi:ribosomal protein S18 acetylase RimI-like enzyme
MELFKYVRFIVKNFKDSGLCPLNCYLASETKQILKMTSDQTGVYSKNNISDIRIFEPTEPVHFEAVRQLFSEYMILLDGLPDVTLNPDIQSPAAEVARLESGKYSAPDGATLLASLGNGFVGAVALRKFSDGICEMKRLYVRPEGRGTSVGFHLAQQIMKKAKDLGYRKMRLDTLPSMTKAHRLYYSLGFYDIERYNQNMVPGALFMEVGL